MEPFGTRRGENKLFMASSARKSGLVPFMKAEANAIFPVVEMVFLALYRLEIYEVVSNLKGLSPELSKKLVYKNKEIMRISHNYD